MASKPFDWGTEKARLNRAQFDIDIDIDIDTQD